MDLEFEVLGFRVSGVGLEAHEVGVDFRVGGTWYSDWSSNAYWTTKNL